MAYLKILDQNGNKINANSAFEGARYGRRLGGFVASTTGINSLISSSISTLRARARHLRRNNPLCAGAVDSFVADLIGTGISPSWQIDDKELKKEIQQLWNDWAEEADYDGIYDFYGLQSLVSHALVESGEALVWMKTQPRNSDLIVPLQMQVLEGDHLDENYNVTLSSGNGVRMGIEFNKKGKRVAYWLWPEHPGESYGISLNRIRVPANEICHIYRATRPGQKRGTTWLASIIVKMYDYDGYDDAELVRKKGAAMFGGFITEPAGNVTPTNPFGGTDETDSNNRDIVPIEPGTYPVLPPGMDVRFSEPADVGGNYEVFMKHNERSMAKGLGTTREKFTGDLTDVNFSSIRAGLLDFQRCCKQKQIQVLAHQLCRPIAHIFLNTAILSGALNISDYAANKRKYWRIKWRPDAWEWVDPVKDQLAAQSAVRNGFKSREQVVAEMGGDIEEIDIQIAADNKRSDELGIILDSDPRNTAKSGMSQTTEDAVINNSVKEE